MENFSASLPQKLSCEAFANESIQIVFLKNKNLAIRRTSNPGAAPVDIIVVGRSLRRIQIIENTAKNIFQAFQREKSVML